MVNKPETTSATTLVRCLRCEQLVKLPGDVDPNVQVRCPRCNESYLLVELLADEVPELEVIAPSAQADPNGAVPTTDDSIGIRIDENQRYVVPTALSKGAERKKRRRRSSSSQSSSRSTTGTSATGSSGSAKSSSGSSRSKSSRSGGHGASDVLKIVAGALLAPPVALMVLWWGLGIDPAGLGPSVGKVIPALVPRDLREAAPAKDSLESPANSEPVSEDDSAEDKSDDEKILPEAPSNIERRSW